MRQGGGKQKGSSFERLVCVKFSLWLSDGKNEDLLWRSSMSGGRSTVAAKKGKRLAAQAGDISSIHTLSAPLTNKFLIECKTYRLMNYEGLLTGRGNLLKFWHETRVEAKKYGKLPLLIAKQNQQPVTACLTPGGLEMLGLSRLTARIICQRELLCVLLFDEFLKHAVPPK